MHPKGAGRMANSVDLIRLFLSLIWVCTVCLIPFVRKLGSLWIITINKKDVQFSASKHAYGPPHNKTNKMACAPSKDSDQHGHLPSLIRVFAVGMKKACVLSYPLSALQRRWSDRADAQADLSLRRAHSNFVGFVMRWLILSISLTVWNNNNFQRQSRT